MKEGVRVAAPMGTPQCQSAFWSGPDLESVGDTMGSATGFASSALLPHYSFSGGQI